MPVVFLYTTNYQAGDDVPEPMPTELGLLTKLTSLTIGHDLTMELPAELGEMSDLASLTRELLMGLAPQIE